MSELIKFCRNPSHTFNQNNYEKLIELMKTFLDLNIVDTQYIDEDNVSEVQPDTPEQNFNSFKFFSQYID